MVPFKPLTEQINANIFFSSEIWSFSFEVSFCIEKERNFHNSTHFKTIVYCCELDMHLFIERGGGGIRIILTAPLCSYDKVIFVLESMILENQDIIVHLIDNYCTKASISSYKCNWTAINSNIYIYNNIYNI